MATDLGTIYADSGEQKDPLRGLGINPDAYPMRAPKRSAGRSQGPTYVSAFKGMTEPGGGNDMAFPQLMQLSGMIPGLGQGLADSLAASISRPGGMMGSDLLGDPILKALQSASSGYPNPFGIGGGVQGNARGASFGTQAPPDNPNSVQALYSKALGMQPVNAIDRSEQQKTLQMMEGIRNDERKNILSLLGSIFGRNMGATDTSSATRDTLANTAGRNVVIPLHEQASATRSLLPQIMQLLAGIR